LTDFQNCITKWFASIVIIIIIFIPQVVQIPGVKTRSSKQISLVARGPGLLSRTEGIHNESRVEALSTIIERRWNRNEVSRESPDKKVNRRPTSLKKLLLLLK